MNIESYNLTALQQAVSSNETITFSENISIEDLLKVFTELISYEEKDENLEHPVKFDIKNLDIDKLTALYKFWMSKDIIEKIRNSTIILNIILLLKTYNTFDNDFFAHPLIFISSIDKYLDIKLDLQDEIQ